MKLLEQVTGVNLYLLSELLIFRHLKSYPHFCG